MASKDSEICVEGELDHELREYIRTCASNPTQYEGLQDFVKTMIQNPEEWLHYYSPLQVKPHPCLAEYSIEAIGSSSEQLAVTEVSEVGCNVELDFSLVLKNITATHDTKICNSKNMAKVSYSKDFPGHVYLCIQESETASAWNNFCNIISNEEGNINEFYISPEAINDELYMMICYRNATEDWTEKYMTLVNTEIMSETQSKDKNRINVEPREVIVRYYMTAREGPAVKTSIFYKSEDISLQFDCAVAIHCLEWPAVAKEWIERERKSSWPNKSIIRSITSNGCLLVPKCPLSSKTALEWRILFCLVERDLMKTLKEEQKQCYILLKCIWRQFLKPPSGKALQSYHLKNVLLWECENVDIDDWTSGNIVTRVKGLLSRLKNYIENRHCPHYIVPENNLFKDIDVGVLHRTGERVEVSLSKKTDYTWVKNSGLFSLPPEKTRLGIGEDMLCAYFGFVEDICRSFVNFKMASSFVDFRILDAIFEKVALKKLIGSSRIIFVMEMMKLAMTPNERSLMRRYICTRGSPKQLYQAAKGGVLEFIACIVRALMLLSELTEVVTKIEILKTQNFEEYGFPEGYCSGEIDRILSSFLQQCSIDNGYESDYYQVFEEMQKFSCKLGELLKGRL